MPATSLASGCQLIVIGYRQCLTSSVSASFMLTALAAGEMGSTGGKVEGSEAGLSPDCLVCVASTTLFGDVAPVSSVGRGSIGACVSGRAEVSGADASLGVDVGEELGVEG